MKKFMMLTVGVLILGVVLIVLIRDDQSVMGGFIKLIGLSLTLISAFFLILNMIGLSPNKLE
jgi:hypothetical protein